MKILLLGEYSNVHATLALGLRQLGHEVTVVSNGDFWKDYPRDIDVSRPKGPLAGLRLTARIATLLPRLKGYDVVQLINPLFFELRAERLAPIYRHLRRHNGRMVLCAMGMDYYWVSENTLHKPLRYGDFNIGDSLRTDEPALREQREWMGTAKEQLNRLIATDCDDIVAGLYEYMVCYRPYFASKLHFVPMPIVPQSPRPIVGDATPQPVRVFVGISRGRSAYKGTDIMLRAAEAVANRHPGHIAIVKAEGVPYEQYQHMMDSSDVILDQLYSYTPAMNALLAMSKGIVCVGGGEPENYDILCESHLRPIINVEPTFESVCHQIEQIALHPERIPPLKRQSIEYIERHHHYLKVAKAYEQIYQQPL